jgi:CAAX prenyl protease-like protein
VTYLRKQLTRSPIGARVAPFVVFLLITGLIGQFEGAPRFWLYLVKTLAGAGLLWLARPALAELEWRFSGLALGAGVLVFGLWIGLEGLYPKWGKTTPWNPHEQFGAGSAMAWFFIVVRTVGSTLVVPPLEEIFYRSFVYRYVAQKDFLALPLNRLLVTPFLAASVLFALGHYEWLPALLTGFIFQAVVIRTNRLGDAITAHAVANLLLALWVVGRQAWIFW